MWLKQRSFIVYSYWQWKRRNAWHFIDIWYIYLWIIKSKVKDIGLELTVLIICNRKLYFMTFFLFRRLWSRVIKSRSYPTNINIGCGNGWHENYTPSYQRRYTCNLSEKLAIQILNCQCSQIRRRSMLIYLNNIL